MSEAPRIEKLSRAHALEGFDCGKEPLNRFLARHALESQQSSASQTYVACVADRVVGYYTLVFGQVAYDDAPERLRKGLARNPVPIIILARLAIAVEMQGQGLGAGLLKESLLRTLQASEIAGLRALAVHAKDEVRAFYERFDFMPSPVDPFHLFVLLKDVKGMLA